MTTDIIKKKKPLNLITTIGAVALVIIVIANLVVWKDNRSKQSQITAVNRQINQAQLSMKNLPAADPSLDARLTAAKNTLAQAQNALPATVDRNDIIDFIVTEAAKCHVTAIPLEFQGVVAGTAKSPYNQLLVRVNTAGTLADTESFISGLRSNTFPTLVITGCSIEKQSPTDLTKPEAGEMVSTELILTIYTSIPAASEDNTP